MLNTSNFIHVETIYKTHDVQVMIVIDKVSGAQYCIKKYNTGSNQVLPSCENEINLLYSLNHPNILKILGHTFRDDSMELILEYCSKRDMCDEINRRIKAQTPWSELQQLKIMGDLIHAFKYLQDQRIAHRDIKPDNILISADNTFKISDLGSSKRIFGSNSKTIVGTSYYMSPELRGGQAPLYGLNRGGFPYDAFKSDVWSLGLTFLVMVSLKSVEDFNDIKNIKNTINSRVEGVKNVFIRKILNRMICMEKEERPDFIYLEKYFEEIIHEAKTCERCQTLTEDVVWCQSCYKPFHTKCLKEIEYKCCECYSDNSTQVVYCTLCEQRFLITDVRNCNHLICKNCESNTDCNFCIGIDIIQQDLSFVNSVKEHSEVWCKGCTKLLTYIPEQRKLNCINCSKVYCSICKDMQHEEPCYQKKNKYSVLCRCLLWRQKDSEGIFIDCPICRYICVVCYRPATISHYLCTQLYSSANSLIQIEKNISPNSNS